MLALSLEHYPDTSADFPHQREDVNRSIVTTKLKAVRGKYRGAVDTGRRSKHGRVVFLYFELCEQVRGGSPSTTTLPTGVETNDLDTTTPSPASSQASSQASSTLEVADAAVGSEVEVDAEDVDGSVAPVKERRDLLNIYFLKAKLKGHRHE